MARNKKNDAVEQPIEGAEQQTEQAYSSTRENTDTTTLRRNAPIKKFRARGVFVHVFENFTDDGRRFLKANSPMKTYKDGESFKTTSSLGTVDVLIGEKLMGQAAAFMLLAEAVKSGSEE